MPETLSLRPTLTGNVRNDDYQMIWRDLPVGRIMKISGVHSGGPQWWWGCTLPRRPMNTGDHGTGDSLHDCEAALRVAWARIRAQQQPAGPTTST
jgi:hypothetical protein